MLPRLSRDIQNIQFCSHGWRSFIILSINILLIQQIFIEHLFCATVLNFEYVNTIALVQCRAIICHSKLCLEGRLSHGGTETCLKQEIRICSIELKQKSELARDFPKLTLTCSRN